MPTTLDHITQPARDTSILPAVSMLLGLLSAPIAFGMDHAVHYYFPLLDGEARIFIALGICAGASLFALCIRLELKLALRDRVFTHIGIAAPILWVVFVVSMIIYAIATSP